MTARSRSYTNPTAKGRIVTNGALVAGGFNTFGSTGVCNDHVVEGDNQPLWIDKLDIQGGRVNVYNNASNYWDNYRVDYLDVPENLYHLGPKPDEDRTDSQYATNAAARSNPSRPFVDLPVAIFELPEITQLIRRGGRSVFARAGRHNLAYHYGIAPFVGDLAKLSQFEDQLTRRMLEIERIQERGVLKRTLRVGEWRNTQTISRVMQSHQYFWTDNVTFDTHQVVKAHVRWIPTVDFSLLTFDEKLRLAMRSVLGLTIDRSSVWEALPWSWLIDWGYNVSEYFKATRNIMPVELADVSIMRETRTKFTSNGVSFGGAGSQSGIDSERVTKTRVNNVPVTPVAHLPILNGREVGILASLAVTRR